MKSIKRRLLKFTGIMIIEHDVLRKIGSLLVLELRTELMNQGHKATGDLIRSVSFDTVFRPDSATLSIEMERYGLAVNSGRKPGGKKVPLDALISWIMIKGLASGDKNVKNMAFAIQTNIHKYGIPTPNSLKQSSTGKRTEFIEDTLNRTESFIFAEIEASAVGVVDVFLEEIVTFANAR